MAKYRLTESRLRGMIREAVKTALNEMPLVNMKTKERQRTTITRSSRTP